MFLDGQEIDVEARPQGWGLRSNGLGPISGATAAYLSPKNLSARRTITAPQLGSTTAGIDSLEN